MEWEARKTKEEKQRLKKHGGIKTPGRDRGEKGMEA